MEHVTFPYIPRIPKDIFNNWREKHQDEIIDILKANDFKIISFDINDFFYEYLKIKHETSGKIFNIGFTNIESENKIKQLYSFIRNFDLVLEAYNNLKNITSPFYTDIEYYCNTRFKEKLGKNIAFNTVCQFIKQDGKRIWS